MNKIATQEIKKIMLMTAAIILMVAVAACGDGKSGGASYKETITADQWVEKGGEVYAEIPSEEEEEPEALDSPAPATSQPGVDPSESKTADTATASSVAAPVDETPRRRVVTGRNLGNLAELFNDSNHFQLLHAERLGIDPITDLRSYYHTKRPLVRIETNEDFMVEELTHSYPYLIPEADRLLHDIGRAFRDSVKSRRGGDYRMVVTSLLRTPVTVKKLRRVNRNATEQSTHQYATTFDIAYNKFNAVSGPDDANYGDLKLILAEVIRDLHAEGRCMVKYERKSPCFHITVVR
ncbi:MAG: hypothetical protein HDS25_00555 [Bacteroides sp.]|nr:hypothetical protein [Bacteroides sp.]